MWPHSPSLEACHRHGTCLWEDVLSKPRPGIAKGDAARHPQHLPPTLESEVSARESPGAWHMGENLQRKAMLLVTLTI
jgi:hypothetical protein